MHGTPTVASLFTDKREHDGRLSAVYYWYIYCCVCKPVTTLFTRLCSSIIHIIQVSLSKAGRHEQRMEGNNCVFFFQESSWSVVFLDFFSFSLKKEDNNTRKGSLHTGGSGLYSIHMHGHKLFVFKQLVKQTCPQCYHKCWDISNSLIVFSLLYFFFLSLQSINTNARLNTRELTGTSQGVSGSPFVL